MSHASISEASRLRFVNARLHNGVITDKANPGTGEVKIPGVGTKSVEALRDERITTYYQFVGTMFAKNWLMDDLKDYLKSVGMAGAYIDTVLLLVWNHVRMQQIEQQPLVGFPDQTFHNGRLVTSETLAQGKETKATQVGEGKDQEQEEDDELFAVPGLTQEDIDLLAENDIETFYGLIGRLFYLGWRKETIQRHFTDIGLSAAKIDAMHKFVRTQIHLDELEGRE